MSCKYSHLLGFELEKVFDILTRGDYEIKTTELSPPVKRNGDGIKRVINIKIKDNQIAEIFWSYESYT